MVFTTLIQEEGGNIRNMLDWSHVSKIMDPFLMCFADWFSELVPAASLVCGVD